jgi:alcohol dehydrogenase
VRAAYFEAFGGPVSIANLPDPSPAPHGVVLRVTATGLCRSDWHGWMGHDADVTLPHVPGHELAGVVESVGREVERWRPGARVTLPFVCGCGSCPQCASGNHQVCDRQFQPGFTHWGSFAEFVAIGYADTNLVALPDDLDHVTAASLGCRFATSFRAVVDQGAVAAGQWVAVYGCGGVGLSAIMIAAAMGARVVAVDIFDRQLELARSVGAECTIRAGRPTAVIGEVVEVTGGGADLSIDALGHPDTCFSSVACLRKRGRHVQVGLLEPRYRNTALPMDLVVARELEVLGSHGMSARRYPQMLEMIRAGQLRPDRLVGRTIGLDEAPAALTGLDEFAHAGVTVIDRF